MKTFPRPTLRLAFALALVFLCRAAALGGDPIPTPPAAPVVASAEEAKAAISTFKAAFKTKDIEAKLEAVDALARVNHPLVIDELAKLFAHRNAKVRSVAGQQFASAKATQEWADAHRAEIVAQCQELDAEQAGQKAQAEAALKAAKAQR